MNFFGGVVHIWTQMSLSFIHFTGTVFSYKALGQELIDKHYAKKALVPLASFSCYEEADSEILHLLWYGCSLPVSPYLDYLIIKIDSNII